MVLEVAKNSKSTQMEKEIYRGIQNLQRHPKGKGNVQHPSHQREEKQSRRKAEESGVTKAISIEDTDVTDKETNTE